MRKADNLLQKGFPLLVFLEEKLKTDNHNKKIKNIKK